MLRRPAHLEEMMAARVVVINLIVPWGLLMLLSEPDRPDRTLWLWPLQLSVFAAVVSAGCARMPSRAARTVLVLIVLIAIASNAFVMNQVRSWREHGWVGSLPPQMLALEFVANRLTAAGERHTSIGYQDYGMGYVARYNVLDPRYRWGAGADAWLQRTHGIANDNRCAEGVSAGDEWRIIEAPLVRARAEDVDAAPEIVAGDMTAGFAPQARFGPFVVFKRVKALADDGRSSIDRTR